MASRLPPGVPTGFYGITPTAPPMTADKAHELRIAIDDINAKLRRLEDRIFNIEKTIAAFTHRGQLHHITTQKKGYLDP